MFETPEHLPRLQYGVKRTEQGVGAHCTLTGLAFSSAVIYAAFVQFQILQDWLCDYDGCY